MKVVSNFESSIFPSNFLLGSVSPSAVVLFYLDNKPYSTVSLSTIHEWTWTPEGIDILEFSEVEVALECS